MTIKYWEVGEDSKIVALFEMSRDFVANANKDGA